MGGHALVHKRAEHFLMPPLKLIVIGLDTDHVQGEHPLWRADAKDTVPDALFIASIRKHGIIQPVRARKTSQTDTDTAEVVVGRERVKAARILEAEGLSILVPTLLWPMGTPDSEIIGAANAENYQRKHESAILQAEHIHMQLRALGYFDGASENECIKNVSVSTGMSPQRIKNLLAFREDDRLVKAVIDKEAGSEAALAIATLPPEEREKQLAIIIADPSKGTVVETRERVAYVRETMKADAKAAKVHNGVGAPATKTKTKKDDGDPPAALGLSKPLLKRIVASQMALPANDRDVDMLVLKAFKVAAGGAAPTTVPGLAKAMKALGL